MAIAAMTVSGAHAATFSVGAGGTFSTIQAGLNAAIAAGGSNEVRVEAGSYTENLTVSMSAGALDVSGGWNAAFTQRNLDPTATFLSGGVVDRVLNASVTGSGSLSLAGLLIVGGTSNDRGGGIFLHLGNTALAQIRDCNFGLNTVQANAGGNALGGAFYAEVFDASGLIFDGNLVSSNSASVSTGASNGGGLFVEAFNSSNVAIADSLIEDNVAAATSATGRASAGGIQVEIADSAQFAFDRNQVLANSLQASDANHATFSGAFFQGGCAGACELGVVQSIFDRNAGFGAFQLAVGMGGSASMSALLSNLLVSRGDGRGAQVQMDAGTANLVNLTVADNPGIGLYLVPNSTITLFNTIAFGNGADLSVPNGTVGQGNNLIGVDPHFVDPALGNYRLVGDSPARDAGTATPPGGLGLFDLDGNARTFGPAPDIGAYEIGDEIFKDGFE